MSYVAELKTMMDSNKNMLYLFCGIILITLYIWIFIGHRDRIIKLEKNNKNMSIYLENTNDPKIVRECCSNIKSSTIDIKRPIRDFYVLSSYNSCSGGKLHNDYVDFEPLKQVIKSGVRYLDFEIFSKNGIPVIAGKLDNIDNGYKSTYNHLDFRKTMQIVKKYALSGMSQFPKNNDDPLFLNFRIKGNFNNIYNQMSDDINEIFASYLLPSTMSNSSKYTSSGLSSIPLYRLKNKVIILCDDIKKGYKNSNFIDLINYNSSFNTYESDLFKDPYNIEECTKRAKKNLTISYTKHNRQLEFPIQWSAGVTFSCLNFNSNDAFLKGYLAEFNRVGQAFLLKPKHLIYKPVMAKPTKKQNIKNYDIKVKNPFA